MHSKLPESTTATNAAVVVRVSSESGVKGAITSQIKHAVKLKTSPARLAQLLNLVHFSL